MMFAKIQEIKSMLKTCTYIFTALCFLSISNICESAPPEGQKSQDRLQRWQEIMKSRDKPIDFWGAVTDQRGKPIVDAQVFIHIGHSEGEGLKELIIKTDSHGHFEVINEKGYRLYIANIVKKGYEFAFDNDPSTDFNYWAHLEKDLFKPDKHNPIVFTLRKKEAPEFVIPGDIRLEFGPKSAEQEMDLVKGYAKEVGRLKKTNDEHADVRIKGTKSGDQSGFVLTFTVAEQEGGVILSDERLYVTPTDGYVPSQSVSTPDDGVTKKYLYVKARKGGLYARLDVEIRPRKDVVFVSINSWANPNGSRNVDYDDEVYGRETHRKNEERKQRRIERGKKWLELQKQSK
jgi:hypothetical protein